MSFINKIVGGGVQLTEGLAKKAEPVFRFGGWERMGAHTRPVDTRTTEQLIANIDYFAQRNPEVAQFQKELKTMNPEHLGLASDICELANSFEIISENIDIKKLRFGWGENKGKTLFAYLMEILPKVSKENPKALDFTKEVVNQTDKTASRYFLADFGTVLDNSEFAEHFSAAKPMVKDIAKQTLDGGYRMGFEKERNFMDFIKTLINSNSKPEKVAILPKLCKATEVNDITHNINLDTFIQSSAPVKEVEKNIAVLPQVLQNAEKEGKTIDVVDFVNNNVNLY